MRDWDVKDRGGVGKEREHGEEEVESLRIESVIGRGGQLLKGHMIGKRCISERGMLVIKKGTRRFKGGEDEEEGDESSSSSSPSTNLIS